MPRWTTKQRAVIEHRGASLMVSAAAGSGKTAVMIQRILSLILEDGVDVDRLLVVTFTRAAAGEMKERLARALEESLARDPERAPRIRSQLEKLEDAAISTLHAFCGVLLKRYYALADLDPGFRLAAEDEVNLLWQQAAEDALEQLFAEEDADFMEAVRCWGGRDGRDMLEGIDRVYRHAMARPGGLSWAEDAAGLFEAAARNPEGSPAYAVLREVCRSSLGEAAVLNASALALAEEEGGPAHYAEALESDRQGIAASQDALEVGWQAAKAALSFAFAPLSRKRYADKERAEAVKALRSQVKDLVKEARTLLEEMEDAGRRLTPMIPAVRGLVKTVQRAAEVFAREKALRGILDFNDLEHKTLQILSQEAVREEVRALYRYVFVDEYQDTNGVQEAIVTAVASEDSLFCVGDVKQSIYRFRQADPTLFLARYARSSPMGEGTSQRVDLNQNFRSHPGILEAVNAVFSRIMSPELGDILYDDAAALYPGAPRPEEEDGDAPVHMALLREPDAGEDPLQALSRLEAQALYAARKIREGMTRPIWDGKLGAYRPARYGDFVILLRVVRGRAPVVANVLRAQGIPVVADGGEGYYDQTEVAQVLDCLAWIDHRERDLPLINTLHSGMGGFTMAELYRVRRAYPQEPSFCRAAVRYADEAEDTLAWRLGSFLRRGEAWRSLARQASVEEVIWRVLEDTGFYDWVGTLPGGDVRQGNLRLLAQKARTLSESWARNLYGFLSHVERVRDTQTQLAEAQLAREKEEMVQVLSIHKSKGLEYPVVILLGLEGQYNERDTTGDLLLHDALGLAPRSFFPRSRIKTENILHRAAAHQIRQEGLSELMRVLYVAMTRARERLILVGRCPDEKKMAAWARPVTPYSLAKGQVSLLDWLGPVALRAAGGEALAQAAGYEGLRISLQWPWEVCIQEASELPRETAPALETGKLLDAALHGAPDPRLLAAYQWRYPYSTYPLAGKTTATALLREDAKRWEKSFAWKELPLPLPHGEAGTALERGTWTHTLLEALRPGMDSAAQALEDLVARGLLPPAARDGVDLPGAQAFLESPLMGRIAGAAQVLREQPFVLEIRMDSLGLAVEEGGGTEERLVQGVIDLAFLEEDGWTLVDYKTNRIAEGEEARILAWYRPQLAVYREALVRLTGRPVKAAGLYLTRFKRFVWETESQGSRS